MESLSPNIFVNDIGKTIAYYKMLGFAVVLSVPDNEPYNWAMMTNGNVSIMFQTFADLGKDLPDVKRVDGGSLILYIKLKGIRKFYESLKSQVEIIQDLHKTFYGATEFVIKDCNEYILTFAEDEAK
ncbi:MAG: glyoxalase [Ignavibacteriales bacterium]|nr:glyoxalase [Ignavibacteriales bacterium]